MKRLTIILMLILCLMLAFSACNTQIEEPTNATSTEAPTEEVTAEITTEEVTAETTTEEVTTEATTEEVTAETTTEEVTTEITTEEVTAETTTEEVTTETTTEEVTAETTTEEVTAETTTEEVTAETTTEEATTEAHADETTTDHAGTEDDPYSVKDALKILDSLTANEITDRVFVTGIVTDVGSIINDTYVKGIKIADENDPTLILSVYSANPYDEYDLDIWEGDTLLLDGFLRHTSEGYKEMGSKSGEYTWYVITAYVDDEGGDYYPDEPELETKPEPTDVMPSQTYKPENHTPEDDILHDAMKDFVANDPDNGSQLAVGLPAQGTYSALVIPVQFPDDSFTQAELSDLNKTFNGSESDTGWQSVSTYYTASSFGKLNLSFDILSPVTMTKNSSAYEIGDYAPEDILDYALDSIDAGTDLSKYDTNGDGYIDAVYLIYSVAMDYENDSANYWAFVTWHFDSAEYDGVRAHYYLFASVDFMYEDTEDSGSDYAMDGLLLNAVTYIHETGHLLGLDDYYDCNEGTGSDQGLGNADIMDYSVGDHNVYSKLLLGWVTPTVITSTQTVDIKSSAESGEVLMILLDYDGTYFSEYLLIDLYTATGLNKLHAEQSDSLLYGDSSDEMFYGTEYGTRIYHVASSIKHPYTDPEKYGSFTDNNNSLTSIPLIKLIEADGDSNYESDTYDGIRYASADDLWMSGDKLSVNQPNYTRHDNKLLNFDISFDSVTKDKATITVTFDGSAAESKE